MAIARDGPARLEEWHRRIHYSDKSEHAEGACTPPWKIKSSAYYGAQRVAAKGNGFLNEEDLAWIKFWNPVRMDWRRLLRHLARGAHPAG